MLILLKYMRTYANERSSKHTSDTYIYIVILGIVTALLSVIDKSFSIDGGTCTRADDWRFVGAGVLFLSVERRRMPREGNICTFSRKRTCVRVFDSAKRYICVYVVIKFAAR